jgi:hypothetical protein
MIVVICSPAVVWVLFHPSTFVYFNLIGISVVLMLGLFKVENRILGFNPFTSSGIPLSPEVREIILRIAAWFKRHESAIPGVLFVMFLFSAVVSISIGPAFNSITDPLLGLGLVGIISFVAMVPLSALQIAYQSAIHPRTSSVGEILKLIERVGSNHELTSDSVERASKVSISEPIPIARKICLGISAAFLVMLEFAGSGLLSQKTTIVILMIAMALAMGSLAISFLFSKRRTILQDLTDTH